MGECRSRFEDMTTLVRDGKLKEGLRKSNELGTFLDRAPEAVENAEIMSDMRVSLDFFVELHFVMLVCRKNYGLVAI